MIFRSSLKKLFFLCLVGYSAISLGQTVSIPALKANCDGGVSDSFTLSGGVTNQKTFTLETLQQYTPSKLDVWYYTGKGPVQTSYIGVLLADLLNEAVVVTDPAVKNDILSKYVLVRASDCYEVVVAVAELLSSFGGDQIMVAYATGDGQLLSSDGMARLVVPGDKSGGRYVSNITTIQVLSP
ncbi:MAG TPA: molybdopterin-dependent oxidoreductase [Candidatus Competibacteraceae bacterium]|nr:MAG: hypothetical protein EKK71_09660 [Candidatus Competibacteraceae bacterium]HOB60783.1 molybdopterin-dependent oxidoreductase [Candidatus Competibacteraceae bacterium]HQA25709.1 molybdopterin-dependent oxidoreductase [Candidatus Competibacteraceae bacterium]HQD56915.1 molybdopterin-dependent oxidoreductase [Candidatus Competibacteraceae bacterium]